MPLVKTPDQPDVVTPNLVINPTPYETPVVDTRKEGYDAIATYLAGSKMAADVYRQVQRRDSAPKSFQRDLPFAFGQLELIRGFEFVVTSPITYQQNSGDQRGFSATGSAQCYSIVTLNQGDVFLADIGDGRNAIFQITSSSKSTIRPESTSTIEFKASFLLTPEYKQALDERVIETFYFSRENFRNGVKCLLTDEDVNVFRRLNKAHSRLINLYFRDFYNEQYKTLLVPDQASATYDPFLANYIKATVDPQTHPRVIEIVLLGLGGDPSNDQQSIYDVILDRDPDLLYSVAKRMGVADVSIYRQRPLFKGIYYSGVQGVVTAIDAVWNADKPNMGGHETVSITQGGYRQGAVRDNLPNLDLTTDADKPAQRAMIYPVTQDDYYVLSKAFYEDLPEKSLLEQLLHDRLNNRTIDLGQLADLADAAHTWMNVDRFYYIPIILTLIKLAPGVI